MGYFFTFLLGALAAIKSQHQEHSERGAKALANEHTDTKTTRVVFSEADVEEYRHNQKEQSLIQKSLRRAAWFTFWAVFIYAAITLAIWYATNKTAKAAKETADTTAKQLELAERPWMTAKIIGGEFDFQEDGSASFKAAIVMKNIGRSPAIAIDNGFSVILPKREALFTEPLAKQKELCDALRKRQAKPIETTGISILFPNEETSPLGFSTSIPKEWIDQAALPPTATDPHRVIFAGILVGCVDYQFTFTGNHHQTGYIYEISRREPTARNPNFPYMLQIGVSLPPDRIILTEYFFGGRYAD
jgi:hypothetical protein